MFSIFSFALSMWSFCLLTLVLSKTSLNSMWFFLLCMASMFFYMFGDILYLCLSWSLMGFSSYAMIGKSPTFYTWKATKSILWLGHWSTFLCFFPFFLMNLDLDQDLNLLINFPKETMKTPFAIIFFMGFSMKSLIFPFSYWLLYAMKGLPTMSGLVHSLTMVFSGVFLLIMTWFEGWLSSEHMQLTFLPFILSSTYHMYRILYEDNFKRILAWSTAFSMNLCHISLPWDPSFAFIYGLSHGLSKSFLFNSVQGKMELLWSFIMGLLSGFPMSLTWNMKMWFLYGNSMILSFYLWGLLGYVLLYMKFSFKMSNSLLKSFFMFSFGIIWATLAMIISILFF